MTILYILLFAALWFSIGLLLELRIDIYHWWIGIDDLALDDQVFLWALLGPLGILPPVRRFIAFLHYSTPVILKARKPKD